MLARKKNRCIGKKQNKLNKTTSSNQNVGSPFYNSEFYLFLVVSSPLEPRVHLHLRSCSSIEWTLAVDNHCSIGSSMHAKSRKRKQLCHVCVAKKNIQIIANLQQCSLAVRICQVLVFPYTTPMKDYAWWWVRMMWDAECFQRVSNHHCHRTFVWLQFWILACLSIPISFRLKLLGCDRSIVEATSRRSITILISQIDLTFNAYHCWVRYVWTAICDA